MKFIEDNNKSILGDFSWDKKYPYKKYERATTDKGQRTYDVEGKKIPSVTTILSATKPKESQESLQKWRDRVGVEEARKITQAAALQVRKCFHRLPSCCSFVTFGCNHKTLPFINARIRTKSILDDL